MWMKSSVTVSYTHLDVYKRQEQYWVDEGYDFGALANLLGADSVVLK